MLCYGEVPRLISEGQLGRVRKLFDTVSSRLISGSFTGSFARSSWSAGGLLYLATPLYNAARDDLPSAVAALLALPDVDATDESGCDQGSSQCGWAPAGTGLLSGTLMGYRGA